MKLHDVYQGRKVPIWALAITSGTVALAAAGCSSSSSSAESGPTVAPTSTSAPVATTSAPASEGICQPDMRRVGDTIDPSKAMFVLAGIAELSDGTYVGRPPLIKEGNKWDVASLQHIVGETAMRVVNYSPPLPLSSVHIFAQEVVDTTKDGCLISSDTVRPPQQGQAVTITGTVSLDGQTYASFNNGSPTASTVAEAYNDGAVDIPMPQLLSGFGEL